MSPTLTFQQHIVELRHRVLWIFLAIIASGVIGYNFRLSIIRFISKPLGAPLYYTNPAGSFNFEIKVSLIVSMFIALPVIVYQILRFIQPALPQKFGKKMITLIIASSFTLASIGIAFGYYVIVPLSLHFFAKYSTGQLKPLISSDSYLSYLTNNLVIFALVFQIPLLIYFINKIKPLKPKKLLHLQRYVIVGSFIIALILPFTYDPISQFVVAIPIIFLYYLSILIVLISNRKISKPKIEYVEEGPNLFIDEPIVQEIKEEIIQAVHEVNEIIEPAVNLIEQKAKPALKFIDGIYSERTNKLIKSNSSSNYHYRISPKIITLSNEESSEDEPFSINVATG